MINVKFKHNVFITCFIPKSHLLTISYCAIITCLQHYVYVLNSMFYVKIVTEIRFTKITGPA